MMIKKSGVSKHNPGGDPHVNLCLAVLKEAKRGNTRMWRDFKAAYDRMKHNHNPFKIACWVGEWWRLDQLGLKP